MEDVVQTMENDLTLVKDKLTKQKADLKEVNDKIPSFTVNAVEKEKIAIEKSEALKLAEDTVVKAEKAAKEAEQAVEDAKDAVKAEKSAEPVDDVKLQAAEKALSDKEIELDAAKKANADAVSAYETAKTETDDAKDAYSDAETQLGDIKSEKADLESSIAETDKDLIDTVTKKDEDEKKLFEAKNKFSEEEKVLEELKSQDIVKEYNNQVKAIKRSITQSVSEEDSKVLLSLDFSDDAERMKIARDDHDVVREELKSAMEVTDSQLNGLEQLCGEIAKQKNYINAGEAFELARKSLFNLDDVIALIEAAAKEGKMKIRLNEEELTGTIMFALGELGYQLTFEERSKFGRSESDKRITVTISWEFVAGQS